MKVKKTIVSYDKPQTTITATPTAWKRSKKHTYFIFS